MNFRDGNRSESAVQNRAMESVSLHEHVTDAFHDLYDAIDKVEANSTNESASFFPTFSVAGSSLGDLLRMNIS